MEQVLDRLEWHRRRRLAGVPTVSVLVGPVDAALDTWRTLAERQGRPFLHNRMTASADVAKAFARWARESRELRTATFGMLASRLGLPPDEIEARLLRYTTLERTMMLDRAALDPREPATRFCRDILLRSSDEGTSDEWLERIAPLGHELTFVGRLMALLLREDQLPALIVAAATDSDDVTVSLRSLYEVAQECPALPVALAITGAIYESCVASMAESREKALMHEGLVRLEDVETRGHADSALSALRHAGVSDATIFTYERLAREPVERIRADDGARSEAERFLAKLLDELSFTSGLFELNGLLPIPFGNRSNMEIDLLCRRHQIAVEIDGYYHFQDESRYRTDRTKDYLLQRHGYLVIRYLAEDVVSNLEGVLQRLREALDSRSDRVT